MKVFMSYAREDASFVRRLAADLEARGIDVWLDTDDLASNDEDRWRRSIVQGIRESTALVVVLSPDSVQSGPVEREITIAAETRRRIIPIVHRPCELPDGFVFELAGVQRVDFVEQPYDQAIDHLRRRIGATEEAPALRPPVGAPTEVVVPLADETGDGEPAQAASAITIPTTSATTTATRSGVRSPPAPVLIALGVGVLFAAIVAFALASNDGDSGDVSASSANTQVAIPDEPVAIEGTRTTSDTRAPEQTAAASTVATTTPPAPLVATAPTSPSTTQPSPDTSEAAADALVAALMEAYNNRDWNTVRRINTSQDQMTDEQFVGGYGSADGFPRLHRQHHVVLRTEPSKTGGWRIIGTLIAWDYYPADSQSTNIACMVWDVDLDAGTAAQSGFPGSDGDTARRDTSGWVPEDEFTSTASRFCAV